MRILLDEQSVNDFLAEHGLETGFVALDAALLQVDGTVNGQPCVNLVATTADGKKLVLKATLSMLETVVGACRGRMQYLEDQMATKGPRN